MTSRRWWILAGLYMAGLFALSSVPDRRGEPGLSEYFPPPNVQNTLHIPAYAGLAYLIWRGLRGTAGQAATQATGGARSFAQRHAALLAAALATTYGALDEVHQMFVVGRTASVTDGLANALGAFAVAGWVSFRARRAPGPPTPPR